MLAFHNDLKIKTKYIDRVIAHQKADNLIRGTGWKDGKGCAVGCTLENYNHARYETELGIPEWLARVEDALFEGMTLEKSNTWPEEFLKAINVGADLDTVKTPFLIIILERNLKSLDDCKYDEAANTNVQNAIDLTRDAVKQMIEFHKGNGSLEAADSAAWSAAESAADSAARSADSAARSAARSADSAADSAARSAAESAAWSAAESAAWSADSAARSAARSADSAADSAARSADSAARSAAFDYFADELLKLLRECK